MFEMYSTALQLCIAPEMIATQAVECFESRSRDRDLRPVEMFQLIDPLLTNYQLPNGPVKAGRRWGQRHPQGAN